MTLPIVGAVVVVASLLAGVNGLPFAMLGAGMILLGVLLDFLGGD